MGKKKCKTIADIVVAVLQETDNPGYHVGRYRST